MESIKSLSILKTEIICINGFNWFSVPKLRWFQIVRLTGSVLREKMRDWVNDCKPTQRTVDYVLTVLIDHGGLKGLPRTCRTLMETDTNIKTITVNEKTEVFFYSAKTAVITSLQRYEPRVVTNLSVIEITLHFDGIPIYKSSSDSLWPFLGSFTNLTPRVVFPLNFAMCDSKPDDTSYLDRSVNELLELSREGVEIYNVNIPLVIVNAVADAPARAMLKKCKGHTGYFSCGRCCEQGTWFENRMVFLNTENLQPRTDISFREREHENHHLPLVPHGPSPLLPLELDMVLGFPLDYMHCMCLGKNLIVRSIYTHMLARIRHLLLIPVVLL